MAGRLSPVKVEVALAAAILAALVVGQFLVSILVSLVVLMVAPDRERDAFPLRLVLQPILSIPLPFLVYWLLPPRFERWQLARGVDDTATPPSPAQLARVSPYAVIVPSLLSLPLGIVMLAFGKKGMALGAGVGIFLSIFAFVYHRLPNCRRSVKYGTFYLGSSLYTAAKMADLFEHSGQSDGIALLALFSPMSLVLIYFVLNRRIRPDEPLRRGDAATSRALGWYRWAMASGPGPGLRTFVWTVLRFIPFVGEFYFAARICAKERLARAPVLYLRSFSDGAAATLLARAVSPALGRTCVLAALVHPTQSRAALHEGTHDAWAASSFVVGNERWQAWIVERLNESLAAVVDATILSAHTQWELERASEILGPSRVAVLVPRGTPMEDLPASVIFSYDPDDPRPLADPLRQWIDNVVRAQLAVS
jgi:hypothetical protein